MGSLCYGSIYATDFIQGLNPEETITYRLS